MNLRQKLLLLFSLTVAAAVAAVTWTVLVRIRLVFEQRDQQESEQQLREDSDATGNLRNLEGAHGTFQ